MKRFLSILGALGMTATASSAVVSCDEMHEGYQDVKSEVVMDEKTHEPRVNLTIVEYYYWNYSWGSEPFKKGKDGSNSLTKEFTFKTYVKNDDNKEVTNGVPSITLDSVEFGNKKNKVVDDLDENKGADGKKQIKFTFHAHINLDGNTATKFWVGTELNRAKKLVQYAQHQEFILTIPSTFKIGDAK